VAGFCEHGDVPLGSMKKAGYSLTSQEIISFSNILHHGAWNMISRCTLCLTE
jgi:hypothetical protein